MNIRESILKTLAWFELFEHPLTQEELFRFLWRAPKISYDIFLEELDKLVEDKVIEQFFSFYFLPGGIELVEKRRAKTKHIDKKLKILNKAVKKMRFVPFLEAVFVCNNLSFETAKEDSDIDVFIVARDGRIWIVRFFVTILLSLFRLRRTKNKIKNRVCLSFYCSDKYLNLRSIQIDQRPDIYLVYWLSQLVSIYDVNNIQEKLKRANVWLVEYLANNSEDFFSENLVVRNNVFSKIVKSFFENAWRGRYGDLVEKQLKEIQKVKMKMNSYSKQTEGDTKVVVNDQMLKFHENDRRQYYQDLWQKKISELTK